MRRSLALLLMAAAIAPATALAAEKPKIVLIAGTPSHGPGQHEHNAGILLIQKCLTECLPEVETVVVKGGWPKDEEVFEDARAVVIFSDGGGGHPAIQGSRLTTMQQMMEKGVGLVLLHYAVEVPKGEPGDRWLDWIGGYYESGYSTNPHWMADFKTLPKHPITRGVHPFEIEDEWYYNIRFRPEMKGVTPILVAKPDDEARAGKTSSPRGGYPHIVANKGRDEVVAWAVERPDGGRGFGFTGLHNHKNWANSDFRKLVLNAVAWSAGVDVPEGGISCELSDADLKKNLDPK